MCAHKNAKNGRTCSTKCSTPRRIARSGILLRCALNLPLPLFARPFDALTESTLEDIRSIHVWFSFQNLEGFISWLVTVPLFHVAFCIMLCCSLKKTSMVERHGDTEGKTSLSLAGRGLLILPDLSGLGKTCQDCRDYIGTTAILYKL